MSKSADFVQMELAGLLVQLKARTSILRKLSNGTTWQPDIVMADKAVDEAIHWSTRMIEETAR